MSNDPLAWSTTRQRVNDAAFVVFVIGALVFAIELFARLEARGVLDGVTRIAATLVATLFLGLLWRRREFVKEYRAAERRMSEPVAHAAPSPYRMRRASTKGVRKH